MKRFVLDASALLRFADNEAGVDRVAELAKLAERNQAELYMSFVNWGEVVYALLRSQGTQDDADLIKSVLPLTLLPQTTSNRNEQHRSDIAINFPTLTPSPPHWHKSFQRLC